MSGDIDADEPLVHSLKWITRLCASDGLPLNGVNYWPISFLRTKMANLLGALTYYAGRDPEFAPVATRYLESLMDLPVGFSLEHGGGYFLRGAQYHDRPETLDPIPYQPYLESYSFGNRSHYFLVGKNYQTALDLRSTVPFKGLQTWIYRGQKPIVAPAPNVRSRMLAFGYDSHRMNVPAAGMAVPCYIASVSPDVDIVAVPDETIQTAYIFSRDTTVVVYSQAPGPGLLDWAQYAPVCASVKEIKAGSITFEGTDARLLIPNVVPSVETQGDGTRIRMRFNSESFWYALVGPQSKSVVKHVLSGVFLVHLNESGRIVNFALNLSSQPFSETMFFPGTSIPVPALEPYDAKVVQGE